MENGNLNGLDIQIGHPEFISGSHLDNNEMLKRVQHDVRSCFTRPSSSRSVSVRDIGAALDPRQKPSGMTECVKPSGMTNAAKAFTLIELLVVVLIIGILAAVALPQYQKAVRKSRAAQFAVTVDNIIKAEEVYYEENGTYTGDLTKLDIDIPGITASDVQSETLTKNLTKGIVVSATGTLVRIGVGEKLSTNSGGYGALLNKKGVSKRLLCYEYACHGVVEGSYCKNVLGVPKDATPWSGTGYCFRFYELPEK